MLLTTGPGAQLRRKFGAGELNTRHDKRGIARVIAGGGIARLVSLPVGAFSAGVTAYISVRYAGSENYGYISLIATLLLLMPFLDFGLGAVVLNVASRIKSGERPTETDLRTIWRVLVRITLIALGLCGITIAIAFSGRWTSILGLPGNLDGANYATALALTLFLISTPLYVGQRILIGLGRVGEMTLISLLTPIVTAICTWLLAMATVPLIYLSIAPAVGILIANAVSIRRAFGHLGIGFRQLLAANRVGVSERLAHSAISYVVLSIGWATATQSHRIILAHFSTAEELSSYSLMAQIYIPVLSVITFGSYALWPAYKQHGGVTRELWKSSLKILACIGLCAGFLVTVLSRLAVSFISSGEIYTSALLAFGFGCLIFVISIHQASAMLLTDESGLRFQAYCAVAFAILTVSVSISLAGPRGAVGPVFATVVALICAMLLPGAYRSWTVTKASG